jgi:hypothetical protein
VASDLQSRPPKFWDANQPEKLIERPLTTESKWRYRPFLDFRDDVKRSVKASWTGHMARSLTALQHRNGRSEDPCAG